MSRSKLRKGSALTILLILAVGVGSVVTSFLGRTLVEQTRVVKSSSRTLAWRHALGDLELAKAIVNKAGFVGGHNTAITTALAANPPCIAGTSVYVEAAGPARWYRMTAYDDVANESAGAICYVRDGTSYTAYNYYVEDQSLGISGRPRGKIHSNNQVEFYFANGYYDDFVSAANGFVYKYGADTTNTVLAGGNDPATPPKDLLDFVDFAQLQGMATVSTPANLEAVVTLMNKNLKIDLWTKPQIIQVPTTKYKSVLTGYNWQPVTVTLYTKVWQWVPVTLSKKVWIPVTVTTGGTDLGGGGNAGGYWQTQYYTVNQYKLVNVPSGTTQVWQWVAQYQSVPYTVYVNQTVPGSFVSTATYPANGVFFFGDNIKSLAGPINGKVTLVTEHNVSIAGNIQYKDNNGQTAYLNGTNYTQSYDPNPNFQRNQNLGVIATGDITYALTTPQQLEVNASLISTNGFVGMAGIVLDANGVPSLSGSASIHTSLRRFGSIMAAHRPVSTLLDQANQVIHGFQFGSSSYDRQLTIDPPPGYPSEEVVTYLPTIRAPGASFTSAGSGSYDATIVTPITNLTPLNTVHTADCAAASAAGPQWYSNAR